MFTFVFGVVLKNGIPNFPIYLLSGLLAWNLFSTSLGLAARSVVDNANLVTKVYFPREILPLASVGAASVDFVPPGHRPGRVHGDRCGTSTSWARTCCCCRCRCSRCMLFTVALSLWVGALNVRYRDTQHLLNIGC